MYTAIQRYAGSVNGQVLLKLDIHQQYYLSNDQCQGPCYLNFLATLSMAWGVHIPKLLGLQTLHGKYETVFLSVA